MDASVALQVLLGPSETGLHMASKAQAEQARSVAVDRIGPVVDRLSGSLVAELDAALRLHLGLG